MKRILYMLFAVALLAACSSPRYTAHFNNAPYQGLTTKIEAGDFPLAPATPEHLTASVTYPDMVQAAETPVASPAARQFAELSRAEQREVKQLVKAEMKAYRKAVKESPAGVESTKAMDHDLKLAAIFGAVGLVGLIIGGNVFWIIGGIAMIIGVVFFVKWLIRQ